MGQQRIIYALTYCSLGLLTVGSNFAAAQDPSYQDQSPHAWRRASDLPADQPQFDQAPPNQPDQGPPPPPNFSANQSGNPYPNQPQGGYGTQRQGNPPPPQRMYEPPQRQPQPNIPAQLTIRPGTFVMVRINQLISSDRNQQGDTFFASLAQPLVVDGIVVARRGETVMGRVTEAQKAGRVQGTSRLGVELIGLTLADGQQLQVQSQMVARNGGTSVGSDVGVVAGTTALGAAIGAGADWGRGAAIGAGAGAAAGLLGVLLTRGHPTVLYPESVVTFRVSAPAIVATDRAPMAFRYVDDRDYNRSEYGQGPPPRPAQQPVAVGGYYGGGYYSGYYGPFGYPYYGPTASFYFGPSWYGGYRGGFYLRGGRR